MTVCPWPCGSNWANWLAAASWNEASTSWPLVCWAPARPTSCAPCATGWWNRAGRCSSPPAYRLVQDLLAAKRDLALPRQIRKLDNYDFLLLDDLGYLPQGAEESVVLFTLIAERGFAQKVAF